MSGAVENMATYRRRALCVTLVALAAISAATTSSARAAGCAAGSVYHTCAPGWEITSHMQPTYVQPGGRGLISLYMFDVGAADTLPGVPITVTDVLPEGVTALYAGDERRSDMEQGAQEWECSGSQTVVCINDPANLPQFPGGGTPFYAGERGRVAPPIVLEVAVSGPARTATNHATVSGGGASDGASTTSPLHIGAGQAPFGIANWDVWFSSADGTIDTQAGSHPYTATFDLEVNSQPRVVLGEGPLFQTEFKAAGGELRNTTVDLPAGLVGNPTAVPQCPRTLFDEAGGGQGSACPPDTIVGFASTVAAALGIQPVPIYNLVPPSGVPAELAFNDIGNPVFLDAGVRTGGDSGITVQADNSPTARGALGAVITLFGVPGDSSHDASRCDAFGSVSACASGAGTAPFLTLPTACSAESPDTRVRVNSWQNAAAVDEKATPLHDSHDVPTHLTGCSGLAFQPAIGTSLDTARADTPAGLTVEVDPTLGGLTDPVGVSTADVQNAAVKLPAGLVINPGQAAGLQACARGDVEGGDGLPLPGENGNEARFDGPAKCPAASKVGTVTIKTPLIEGATEKQLEGSVYVLESNPPDLQLLIAASADGVNLKLVGTAHLCESAGETLAGQTCDAPGQLVTTFEGTPELPFSVFRLAFSGGAQAALDTPAHCGAYGHAQGFLADFTPWSAIPGSSEDFVADAFPTAEFALSEGPGGGSCPSNPLPFGPTLTAGATTDQAGAFTAFSMLLSRSDGQQRIERLQFKLPPGLAGMLASIPLCQEPQASQGTCAASSQLGHTVVTSGPGPYPLVIPQPGKPEAGIFLTGPYEGAPFGLSIVTPVIAGPFDLGTIVTRAAIDVDPRTTQVTVTTDPLPQIVRGVPTDLRSVFAVIDRPGFMFNPTNCEPSAFSGTAWSAPAPGASEPSETAQLSSHFGMGSCRELAFTPTLAASTSAHVTKANGTSLTLKLTRPTGPGSGQANFSLAKISFPKLLPSRLTTIQKACTQVQFKANPAGCPAASTIGHVKVVTPELPVPLEGPAYFVSNGNEAFPNVDFVLQGDGVTIDTTATTLIRNGVTTGTLKEIPDAPFSFFELTLPSGPYSEFTGVGNLCREQNKLAMPYEFVAQNGLAISKSTTVEVEGCGDAFAIVKHTIRNRTLTVSVAVPAAGQVKVGGKGLHTKSMTAKGRGTITLSVNQRQVGRLSTKLTVTFTPTVGKTRKRQVKTLDLRFTK